MTRINPNNFLTTIPNLHPASNAYLQYWREQKRRNIEGYWQGGVWMPAKLYFYTNFGTIRLKKTEYSKSEVYSRPVLRDIEWMTLRGWTAARGFSGFLQDPEFSCDNVLRDTLGYTDDDWEYIKSKKPHLFDEDGVPKKYVHPIEYLEMVHPEHYPTPLYQNHATNFMWMTARGAGKSYLTANGIILHELLFNGQDTGKEGIVEYDPDYKTTANQVVGASSSHYSESLMQKVKDSYDFLPGAITLNGITYPCPFQSKVSGSWKLGSNVVQMYKKKVGKKWEEVGSKSTIAHKSFKDNSFAAQGLRCTQMVFEEIGMFSNLEESYMHSIDNMQNGDIKYGSAMFIGTGGDMGDGTVDAYKMFYNPHKYSILSYKDTWETQKDIAFFIPDTYTKNQYKDDWGWTNVDRALRASEAKREELRTTADSTALYQHIQYHPLVPSEVFLSKQATVFPTQEFRERERKMIEGDVYPLLAKKVELYYDPSSQYNGINYKLDIENRLQDIVDYPIKETQSREGAVVIFEFPELREGVVPAGAYLIGHDPYATDAEQGSMATIYVMKTSKYALDIGHNEIVACYVGRPFAGKAAVNEILMKLSLFYGNAKVYFENNVGNVKEYFEKHKRLDLLASRPRTVLSKKAAHEGSEILEYGYPMSNQHIKREAIGYLRDWYLEVHHEHEGKTYRNLDLVPDLGLVRETLAFNFDGNFDRVMAMCGCIIGLRETENQFKNSIYRKEDSGVDLSFITKNKSLFHESLSDPAPFLWR